MSRAATTLWARAIAQELVRSGVRQIAVAPGSRSTPLVMALSREEGIRLRVHLDERSAAFFALGVGKASGVPAAVLTTSGTATANLLPAVVEAAQSEVPLLVLTADRPARLLGADANQAIRQEGLFGEYVRASFQTARATMGGPELRHLRGQLCRAVAASRGGPSGPVHLNIPLDKPLEPGGEGEIEAFAAMDPLAADGRVGGGPFVVIQPGLPVLEEEALAELVRRLSSVQRGIIVAGPSSVAGGLRTGTAAAHLAAVTGFPLLADPLSGARFGDASEALVVPGYDLFLRDEAIRTRLEPELIIRVGTTPTSAAVHGWLMHHREAEQIVVDAGARWKDHLAVAARYLQADATDTLLRLATALAGRQEGEEKREWARLWKAAGEATLEVLAEDRAGEHHEAHILAAVAEAVHDGEILFVSNSMPIRDLDAFAPPRDTAVRVLANRGASGIDGIVSTAFGVATQGATVCVLGDLAFFHDQNGLLWSREGDAPVLFVLVDNDGGSIFRMLPIAGHEPEFTDYFTTPHGMEFKHAAALHGLPLEDIGVSQVRDTVAAYLGGPETRILRVRTDSQASHSARSRVADAVARSVRTALG